MIATDARFEADDDIADNAIRGIALGKRNWLFAGRPRCISIRQTAN
jgi:hypothetical protein